MPDATEPGVPVWTLSSTQPEGLPDLPAVSSMTPERLADLRSALAAFLDSPIVTLEARPLPADLDRTGGIPLNALSPLARGLADVVSGTAKNPAVAKAQASGDVLYRMVVPPKVAAQFGQGLVKPMASKAVEGGVRSALRSSSGIVGHATFVPVVSSAKAGAAGNAATGTVAMGAVGAGTITVAAPVILMAVAVGMTAHAEYQRQQAIERITGLLEKIEGDALDRERADLDGCLDAIDKATSVLLDEGKIGASLGLDSAVHAIGKASASANHRVDKWIAALDRMSVGPVEVPRIEEAFPGVSGVGGEFRAHVELAALAIALKRRVAVLQAVEHAQSNPGNEFENFLRTLRADGQRIDALEARITSVLRRLSSLRLRSSSRLTDRLVTRGYVDELLTTAHRLRELGEGVQHGGVTGDVTIDIVKHRDGSLLVLPAPAQSQTSSAGPWNCAR